MIQKNQIAQGRGRKVDALEAPVDRYQYSSYKMVGLPSRVITNSITISSAVVSAWSH